MSEETLIIEAEGLLQRLQRNFQAAGVHTADEQRLDQALCEVLNIVEKTTVVDNRLLIALERFYKNAALLVGLGNLKLSPEAYQNWRAYDRFHTEKVQSELHLYGPIAFM